MLIKSYFISIKKIYMFVAIILFTCISYKAAAEAAFGMGIPGSDGKSSFPTTVTADSMDMDLNKKIIILEGNVLVNDGKTKINADKIDIYLKNDETKTSDKSKEKTKSDSEDMSSDAGAQQVDKIVALGHVVFQRLLPDVNGQAQPTQKAVGGKAVYETKDGTIVLTKKPMLIYGNGSYVEGTKITLWRDSDRLKVEGNRSVGRASKLVLTPQDQKSLDQSGTGM